MKFFIGAKSSEGFGDMLCGAQPIRQGLAVVLSALMIMIPIGQSSAFAQSGPLANAQSAPLANAQSTPPVANNSQALAADNEPPAPQPLTADQLDQLVAPIALYPDALAAQVLAAATYPTQVVEADRWLQAQGNAAADQIAAGANAQNWDASVKALTAFPSVLAQMDRNLQWTTDLGNAYYNQPQDVMDSVQAMRQKAQAAGTLHSTPQQTVTNDAGQVVIAPANPAVVYIPVYNPWVVYGAPLAVFPGFYYAAPPGIVWGGLALGFGVGIGVAAFAPWGWGYGHWGMGWGTHAVLFNRGAYITHSVTVVNRGFNRPGRAFNRGGAYGANRPGGNYGRPGLAGRPAARRHGAPRA